MRGQRSAGPAILEREDGQAACEDRGAQGLPYQEGRMATPHARTEERENISALNSHFPVLIRSQLPKAKLRVSYIGLLALGHALNLTSAGHM